MAAITTVEHATNRSVYEATHQHPTPNIRLHNASLFAIALFHTHTHTAAHSRGNDMAINGVWLEFNSGECHSSKRSSKKRTKNDNFAEEQRSNVEICTFIFRRNEENCRNVFHWCVHVWIRIAARHIRAPHKNRNCHSAEGNIFFSVFCFQQRLSFLTLAL